MAEALSDSLEIDDTEQETVPTVNLDADELTAENLMDLNMVELKKRLGRVGLSKGGTKKDLANRLHTYNSRIRGTVNSTYVVQTHETHEARKAKEIDEKLTEMQI